MYHGQLDRNITGNALVFNSEGHVLLPNSLVNCSCDLSLMELRCIFLNCGIMWKDMSDSRGLYPSCCFIFQFEISLQELVIYIASQGIRKINMCTRIWKIKKKLYILYTLCTWIKNLKQSKAINSDYVRENTNNLKKKKKFINILDIP